MGWKSKLSEYMLEAMMIPIPGSFTFGITAITCYCVTKAVS